MSAMPERVFLRKENGDRGEETLLVSWLPVAGGGCASYVPESRLLAAEARVREVEAEREKFREQVSKLVDDINGFYPRNQAILEESRALRADREALAPLAALGELALSSAEQGQPLLEGDFNIAAAHYGITAQARALLARLRASA